jgi:ABC-2 type transport system ATP-binding protein
VLLSSHLLGEVEHTVDRLLVIGGGQIVADGPISELLAGQGTAVRALDPASFVAALTAAGLEVQRRDGDVLVVPGADPERVGSLAAAGGHVLIDLRPSEQALEDLFFQLTTTS